MDHKKEIIKKVMLRRRRLAVSTIMEATSFDKNKVQILNVMLNELQLLCQIKMSLSPNHLSPSKEPGQDANSKELYKYVIKRLVDVVHQMETTTKKLIQIEEEKKDILKNFIDGDIKIQEALMEFMTEKHQ
ncbi:uncharacterized protein [Musca autumnalis]|uniref:uncharacterized protein n=1 Tax=Musca autumnalis TaxID=221902 RepID=UPI003CEB0381